LNLEAGTGIQEAAKRDRAAERVRSARPVPVAKIGEDTALDETNELGRCVRSGLRRRRSGDADDREDGEAKRPHQLLLHRLDMRRREPIRLTGRGPTVSFDIPLQRRAPAADNLVRRIRTYVRLQPDKPVSGLDRTAEE